VYLAKTPASYVKGQYASAHTENPASPYYTQDGATEGGRSDIAYQQMSDVADIDTWLVAPFHAIGMLRASLEQVGFARDPRTGDAGLDVIGGLTGTPSASPVLFPGDASTIDLGEYGGEVPDPIETCRDDDPNAHYGSPGLPLIALLPQAPTSELSASLTLPNGQILTSASPNLCIVDEATYRSTDDVYGPTGLAILQGDHAVLVIPRTRLLHGVYSVSLTQPGQPDVSWSFTAAPPRYPAPIRGRAAVENHRLGMLRAFGLPASATGTVTFSASGSMCAARVKDGSATCSLRHVLGRGSYRIVAAYSGDVNFSSAKDIFETTVR
jgi:hypothetical protein